MNPNEFHPAVADVLRFFEYEHLPPELQMISKLYYQLAHELVDGDGPKLSGAQLTLALDHETGFGQGVSSVFVPTDAQRQMIADGYNICLTVIGGQPPVLLRLTDEPIGKAPQPEEDV
jgi:hypothetical protein